MLSNRTNRNVFAVLSCVGTLCVLSRAWDVAVMPESGRAWLKLFGIMLMTSLCFGDFLKYRRLAKDGEPGHADTAD